MKVLLSLIVISAILATGMLVISYVQTALADKITCEGSNTCIGTQGRDTIIGDDGVNIIRGCGDDDVLIGKGGNDVISGDSEKLNPPPCLGANGGDAEPGADKIEGGAGDDRIFHYDAFSQTKPDGHKDIIDCGPGDDEVWINEADGDIANNCETVHTENNP